MFFLDHIVSQLRRVPMAGAVALLAAGILFFDRLAVPAAVVWSGMLVCALLACLLRRRPSGRICIAAAIFMFAGAALSLAASDEGVPANRRIFMIVDIADVPVVREDGSLTVAARIRGYESEGVLADADARVRLWSDGSLALECGDRVECMTALRPFDGGGRGRGGRRLGAGTLFVRAADTVTVSRGIARRSLHATAVERLSRLDLTPSAAAVVAAMGAGERGSMPAAMRESYSRTGVSHILAVSGLHTGIVFLLANLLFGWLILFRHGNLLRTAAVTAAVWLYVAMCGAAPSAVRAATMFTILQFSTLAPWLYSPLNTLAAAAFFMLAVDPRALFEAGFQLSFVAVSAIIVVGSPLYGMVRRRGIVSRFLWTTMFAGIVAGIATAPLTACIFGHVSVTGVLINPAAILCAYTVVGLSIAWTLLPLPMLSPLFSHLLQWSADLLNGVVERAARHDPLSFDCSLSVGATIAIYAAAAAAILIAGSLAARRRREPLFENTDDR